MAWRSSSEACRNGRRSRGAWHCSWGGERVGNMVPMKVWKLVKPPTTSLVGFLFHEVSCYLLHLVTGCSCAVSISSLTPIQHPAEACCGPTLFKVPFGFLLKQVSKVILVLWYCWWPNFCTILDVLAPLNWIEEHTLNWLPDFTQHDRTWYKDWAFSKLMVCSSGWTLLIWWPSFRSFFFLKWWRLEIYPLTNFIPQQQQHFQSEGVDCTRYGHVETVTVCPPKEGAEVKKAPYAFATWRRRWTFWVPGKSRNSM